MTEPVRTSIDYALRNRTAFNPLSFSLPVHTIGCGGVGSHIATALARMGVGLPQSPIYLYDFDMFEEHNLANQHMTKNHIGWSKIKAVKRQLQEIRSDIVVHTRRGRVDRQIELSGMVFLCVDSMEARATIMKTCLEGNSDIECVIETRMDAGVGISHCFDPNNSRHCDCWWEQCYSDKEADNMAGCGGTLSIVSSVYGTVSLALKQFEAFARAGTAKRLVNRVYQDFDSPIIRQSIWPTHPHWD